MSDTGFALVLALMTLAALSTRLSGAFIMSRIQTTPRVERFLEGLAVSVVAALVASHLSTAPLPNLVAVGCAVITMCINRSVIGAMFCGMITAAAVQAFAGL